MATTHEKERVHTYFRKDSGSYYLHYTTDGKRHRKNVGHLRKDAELLRHELELKLRKNEYIFSPKAVTLQKFAEDYLKYIAATKARKTLTGGFRYKINAFVAYCEKKKPTHIRADDINNFILKRLKEVAPITVASDIKVFKAWFNWGKANGYLSENPCDKIQKIRNIQTNPPRFLMPDEASKLLEIAKKQLFYPLIATALYAGLRRKELVHLEWKDIGFENETITVKNKQGFHTKSYRSRTLPLNQKLRAILEPYRKDSGYCFTTNQGESAANKLSEQVSELYRKAGIKNCGLHGLRHTFASHLVMAGVSIYKVSQWLGHADVKTTMVYAHLSSQDDDINRI